MPRPSDHLLRTLAAVPPSCNILEVGCGEGHHTEALLRLGFPVHACAVDADAVAATRERITDLVGAETAATCVQQVAPDGFDTYPADAFHWIIAHTPTGYLPAAAPLEDWLADLRRLLIPGGWLYLALSAANPAANGTAAPHLRPEQLTTHADAVGLAPAEQATSVDEHGRPLVRAIFRLPPAGGRS